MQRCRSAFFLPWRLSSRLPFQLSEFINSESGLNPFGEAAKFLTQAFGFGGVVVLNGVLQKRVQPCNGAKEMVWVEIAIE